ncbi:DNA polymerase III subunit delta' C-terminal domain-containing protein, partial [Chloroflexota bacterium]
AKAGSIDSVTNIDQLGLLSNMARGYSLSQIKAFIQGILAAGEQLRQNANPQLVLEVLMLGIPEVERHGERIAAQIEVKYG